MNYFEENEKRLQEADVKNIKTSQDLLLSKALLQELGIEATIIYSEFEQLGAKNKEIRITYSEISKRTALAESKVKNGLEILEEKGYLSIEKKCMPCTKFYKILK